MINYESLEKVLNKAGYRKTNSFTQDDGKEMVDFSSRKSTRIYTAIKGKYAVECVVVSNTKGKEIATDVLKGLKEVMDSLNA